VQILYIELHPSSETKVELRYQKLKGQGYEKQILRISDIEDAIALAEREEIIWLVGWGWALVESGGGGLSGGVVGISDR
jgi:hypothetical protein